MAGTEQERRIKATDADRDAPEGNPFDGLDIQVYPREIDLSLQAPTSESTKRSLSSLWHRVRPPSGALVCLTAKDSFTRVIRLTVESDAHGWNPDWVKWRYAVSSLPPSVGPLRGVTRDMLVNEDRELFLIVPPKVELKGSRRGEEEETVSRYAWIDFDARLDGYTLPGDYDFSVRLDDWTFDSTEYKQAQLRLRHPPAHFLDYLPSLYRETLAGMYETSSPQSQPYLERYRRRFEETEKNGDNSGEESERTTHPKTGQDILPDEISFLQLTPFFERYLRGFEDALEPVQETISTLERFFDPMKAPEDTLRWLSTWVALVMDENWSQMKRRRLIQEAVELYRWRGTRKGLCRYLEIYAGVVPEIYDRPLQGMRLGDATLPESASPQLGSEETRLGDIPPHTFVVTLAIPDVRNINERIVRDIIEAEKPAHTAYELYLVQTRSGRVEADDDPSGASLR